MNDGDKTHVRTAVTAKFQTMVDMVGQVRALIASGPPGIGKSYGIEHELIRKGRKVSFVRGGLSPIGLFVKLWETRGPDFTLVIDDSDNILSLREGIDLLKAAFDTIVPRRIQWNKMNNNLKGMGIPSQFEYEGQIVFITNMDFRKARPKSRQGDFDALISRAYYIDLEMSSLEAKLMRCQIALEEGMLSSIPISDRGMLFEYLSEFGPYFNEVSLRTLGKLSEAQSQFEDWEKIAATTLMEDPTSNAYQPFAASGTGAAIIEAGQSQDYKKAKLVEVKLFGDTYLFEEEQVAIAAAQHEEVYRRIEIVDDFFLVKRFSERPKGSSDIGKSVANVRELIEASGFKIAELSQEQARELYNFILSNVTRFETVSVSDLEKMVRLCVDNGSQWKKTILTMFTRKAITHHA